MVTEQVRDVYKNRYSDMYRDRQSDINYIIHVLLSKFIVHLLHFNEQK